MNTTEKVSDCDSCSYRGNDGCGPGTVMICEHPNAPSDHPYAAAIISWQYDANHKLVSGSTKCPKESI